MVLKQKIYTFRYKNTVFRNHCIDFSPIYAIMFFNIPTGETGMKTCTINELIDQNFNVIFVNALQQFWHTTRCFQCIGAPKKQNLFLFLNGCKITYIDNHNRFFVANSGDIVYTPIGSEYKAQLSDFQSSDSHTVGINFFLFDECGEPVTLSDHIQIFHESQNQTLPLLFYKSLRYDTIHPLTENRILLMKILCALATHTSRQFLPDCITKSLQYLWEHVEENPSIAHLARLGNISEVYLRKQFKMYLGVSPLEYRNALRLSRAQAYLEYGEISVQEISDMLGYSTVSHFIKEFKKQYGHSPLQYRKLNRMT